MAKRNRNTIEHKVAESILQQDTDSITLGGRTYRYGKPSVATIIMISDLVSTLPVINTDISNNEVTTEVLRCARDCKTIGEIAATLILGAKRVLEIKSQEQQKPLKRHWWSFRKQDDAQPTESEFDTLARLILLECDAKEISDMVIKHLSNLNLGSFFAITASLAEANVLKRTKPEEAESN